MAQFIVNLRPYALQQILNNVVGANHLLYGREPDTRGFYGALVAAPSAVKDEARGEVQDYRWRWKRDSAIVMRYLARIMLTGQLRAVKPERRLALAMAYVDFCAREEETHALPNNHFELGHAKVTLNAKRNTQPWGYPQNDGPAIENFALFEILHVYQKLGLKDFRPFRRLLTVFNRNTRYLIENYLMPSVERWE